MSKGFVCGRAAAVIALFSFAFLQSFPASAAPGATPGDGGVTATGAGTYSIPIRIPDGVNGLQPNLAISYHSRGGRGLAGIGWDISGIPEIRRCGQIHAIDSKQTGISLNANDRFCLNGERLILGKNSSSYGSNGAFYYTEIDDYAKVTSYTSGGYGTAPSSFRATMVQGRNTGWPDLRIRQDSRVARGAVRLGCAGELGPESDHGSEWKLH